MDGEEKGTPSRSHQDPFKTPSSSRGKQLKKLPVRDDDVISILREAQKNQLQRWRCWFDIIE